LTTFIAPVSGFFNDVPTSASPVPGSRNRVMTFRRPRPGAGGTPPRALPWRPYPSRYRAAPHAATGRKRSSSGTIPKQPARGPTAHRTGPTESHRAGNRKHRQSRSGYFSTRTRLWKSGMSSGR
jgi:hypothetical protein